MSTKGFLIFAQNTEKVDYLRQAYALALSIKLTQPVHNSVTLITDEEVPAKYKRVFDNVIDIPWNDEARESEWRTENRWKLIHASPYDETIALDSDMLFFKDISSVWDKLSNHDVFFASNVIDYKGRKITDTVNRRTFIENQLPNVYIALHYFKKTEKSFDFYKTLEFVVRNWEDVYNKITPSHTQKWLSMDVSSSIAVKLLDIEAEVTNKHLDFNFVHMKANLQGWSPVPDSWVNSASHYFTNDLELFINQYKQNEIFHYTEKHFLTDSIIKTLEAKYDS